MNDLTQKSFEEVLLQIKAECKDRQQPLSFRPTKVLFRPFEIGVNQVKKIMKL